MERQLQILDGKEKRIGSKSKVKKVDSRNGFGYGVQGTVLCL